MNSGLIKLFQVGNMPLRSFMDDYEVDQVSVDHASQSFMNRRGHGLWVDTQQNPDVVSRSLRGSVEPFDGMTANDIIQRLKSVSGYPVDFFGYVCVESDNLCPCGRSSDYLIWLHTIGVISDISVSERSRKQRLDLSLRYSPFWEPVNRILYAYELVSPSSISYPPVDYASLVTGIPNLSHRQGDQARWFRRSFSSTMIDYDVALWDYIHNTPQDYPQTGVGFSWVNSSASYVVSPNPYIWGAPPVSFYAVKGLDVATEINLTASIVEDGIVHDYHMGLNLSQITAMLADYSPVTANDVIVFGDTLDQPGVFLRNGTTIEGAIALTEHSGSDFFGQLTSDYAELVLSCPSGQVAALHNFRSIG